MRVDLFDFELPPERIALRPADPRDSARMMTVDPGATPPVGHAAFRDLPSLLAPGDVLILNDTRVIPAELRGTRLRDGAAASVSLTLHKRVSGHEWRAFARPAKRLKPGDRLVFGGAAGEGDRACLLGTLEATVTERGEAGEVGIAFDLSGPVLDEAIEAVGHVPLPPYIASKRADDTSDLRDYQTVYAREPGAVAAPTAGLHFTQDMFAKLEKAGIAFYRVTLHVGAGTFLPVKAEDTADHRMHSEWGRVDAKVADAVNKARAAGGKVVAVGTTALRLLESAADEGGRLTEFSGDTDIFIEPGYRFRVVDRLVTNFHLPRSTLFMLVSAFCGLETMREAYRQAIREGYRFYSYGDTSLLTRARS